jgi:putative transposase
LYEELELGIMSLEVQPDHIHLFVSAPPRYSPANLVNDFKGAHIQAIEKQVPLSQVVAFDVDKDVYVGTAGNVSAQVIKRYIEEWVAYVSC